jgi:CheY-like chemotaxis protein
VEILIVDDEPHIRLAVATMLLKQGYNVFEAPDAIEAIVQLQKHPTITIAICDLRLPGIAGEQLVQVIKVLKPHIQIIVTSVFHRRLSDACQKGADYQLLKPFSRREFLNVLGKAAPGAKAYSVFA